MDRVVKERVLSGSIVRVKIWAADGRILYSDEPRLVGRGSALGEDEREALVSGLVNAELSDLSRPENRFERAEGELLEVYLRVRAPSGEPVLFELYERFDSVVASGRRIWSPFLPALLAALLLLWLVHLPLAYRLARRVRRGHEERRRCCAGRSTRRTTNAGRSPATSTTASSRTWRGPPTRSRLQRAPHASRERIRRSGGRCTRRPR